MEDKLHPLTELMLARMKSHPEEFNEEHTLSGFRWEYALNIVHRYGSDADKQALADGLNPIRMNEAHEWAMDELLNGEERRRKHREEEEEYERRMSAAQQQLMAHQTAINSQYANQASPYGALGGLSSGGVTATTIATPAKSTFSELLKRIKP